MSIAINPSQIQAHLDNLNAAQNTLKNTQIAELTTAQLVALVRDLGEITGKIQAFQSLLTNDHADLITMTADAAEIQEDLEPKYPLRLYQRFVTEQDAYGETATLRLIPELEEPAPGETLAAFKKACLIEIEVNYRYGAPQERHQPLTKERVNAYYDLEKEMVLIFIDHRLVGSENMCELGADSIRGLL